MSSARSSQKRQREEEIENEDFLKRRKENLNDDQRNTQNLECQKFKDFLWINYTLPNQGSFIYDRLISTSQGRKAIQILLDEYEEFCNSLTYYMSILPNEMLLTIFSKISDVKSLLAVPLVCKKWNSLFWAYLRTKEKSFKLDINYMSKQNHLSDSNRSILIDWLFEVCIYYHLPNQVSFFSTIIIDRFSELTTSQVKLSYYQLLGIASLKIACRSLGISAISSSDLIYITADTYTLEELHETEQNILNIVEKEIVNCMIPSPLQFLEHYSQYSSLDCKNFARLLTDLCLIYLPIMKYSSSCIIASCLYVAKAFFHNEWTKDDAQLIGYTSEDLSPCVKEILEAYKHNKDSKFQAFKEKYPLITYPSDFFILEISSSQEDSPDDQ